MNFITRLATTAVILGSTVLSAMPAEARPSHFISHQSADGTYISAKPVGYNGVEVLVDNPYKSTGFIATANCSTGDFSWRSNSGYSDSRMANIIADVCRM